jgi:hypothetical protein
MRKAIIGLVLVGVAGVFTSDAAFAVRSGQGALGGRAITAAETEVPIQISPHALVFGSAGVWVSVHAEIAYSSVARGTVELEGISARWTFPDSRGELVAKFDVDAVKAIVSPPSATLRLTGATVDGRSFSGSDTILVKGGGPAR